MDRIGVKGEFSDCVSPVSGSKCNRNAAQGSTFRDKGQGLWPGDCLNQDLQDLGIIRMGISNPAHPFILKILIQTLLCKGSVHDTGGILLAA